MKYRSEIDGLRAIAVISVIVYHAEFIFSNYIFFPGGYIGVDVFFVISGYLITKILVNDLIKNRYSIPKFFERRIRRIIPPLFFMFLVILPVSYFLLIPSSLLNFSNALLTSIFFISNLFFYLDGNVYGTQDSLLKPLLHTWSLSVEEQFYIIFPFFLILVFKIFNKKMIPLTIIAIIIFNLLFINLSGNLKISYPFFEDFDKFKFLAPTKYFDFYFLTSRFWELLLGSLIVFVEKKISSNESNHWFVKFGFLLIIFSIFYFDDNIIYPSHYTIIPVLGTFLVILFSNRNEIVTKFLSHRYLVFIGLISYSLYIWHYPIFSFYRIANASIQLNNIFFLLLILISVSTLSYYFIEIPFRNRLLSFKKVFLFLSISLLTFLSYAAYINKTDGISYRLSAKKIMFDNEILRQKSWKFIDNGESSNHNYEKDKKNILFIGDSHSKDMFNIFYQNSEKFDEYRFGRSPLDIEDSLNNIIAKIEKDKNFKYAEMIVLTGKFELKNIPLIEKLVKYFQSNSKRVVLLSRSNEYKSNFKYKIKYFHLNNLTSVDKFMLDNNIENISQDIKLNASKILYNNRVNKIVDEVNKELKSLSKKYNLMYLPKQDFLCDENLKLCEAFTDDGFKIFYDYGHYTLQGAKYLGKLIKKKDWFNLDNY